MDKKKIFRLTLFLLVTAVVTVMCATSGNGDTEDAPPLTAVLTEMSGEVKVLKSEEGAFKDAVPNTQIEEQDQVLTGEDGRVRMDLSNGTIIRLSPLSNFTLVGIESTDSGPLTKLQLNIGRLWIILQGGTVEVDTPSGLASVRGSYLHVWVDPQTDETMVTCLEGDCTLGNDGGTIALVAGQTASIQGSFIPPVADEMTDQEVQDWLDANPEATLVLQALTQTVQANYGAPLPESKTNTPTPTATTTSTATITSTPTVTSTAAECGPPDGWVLHTVREGETMESLAALYRVDVADLQLANCRGSLTFVTVGEQLYVPNVATSTPTETGTPTPEMTATPNWTTTIAAGGATPTSSNSATNYSGPVGPDNTVISSLAACGYGYKITATDANGISDVKMIYTFDGSLPTRSTAISAGYYVALPSIATDRYGVSGYVIDTSGKTPTINIRFRFTVLDNDGYVSYFPANDAYDLTDNVGCTPVDVPTSFTGYTGPTNIPDAASCAQTFTVDATDPNGIVEVKLLFNVDGVDPTYSAAVAANDYYLMSFVSGSTYKAANVVIDSSVGSSNTVRYAFSVKDSLGNIVLSPVYTYTDIYSCGAPTYAIIATPVAPLQSPQSCTQTYTIDVSDENGIALVEVQYTAYQDAGLTVVLGTGSFPLSKIAAVTTYDGRFSTSIPIDTSAFLTKPVYVKYDFYVKDNMGNLIQLASSSYQDDGTCTP